VKRERERERERDAKRNGVNLRIDLKREKSKDFFVNGRRYEYK
jgi:hypothetical protein